jgi:hypothetical protein
MWFRVSFRLLQPTPKRINRRNREIENRYVIGRIGGDPQRLTGAANDFAMLCPTHHEARRIIEPITDHDQAIASVKPARMIVTRIPIRMKTGRVF